MSEDKLCLSLNDNSLSQLALTFCKEVLGWEKPEIGEFWAWNDLEEGFEYTDANDVMEYVYGWCEVNGCNLHIGISNGRRAVIIPGHAPVVRDCLKTALLTACIEANRNVNGR